MLVLSRKRGEKVMCKVGGVEVAVTVIEVRGDKVRLGFEAPHEVKIFRDELLKEDTPAPLVSGTVLKGGQNDPDPGDRRPPAPQGSQACSASSAG